MGADRWERRDAEPRKQHLKSRKILCVQKTRHRRQVELRHERGLKMPDRHWEATKCFGVGKILGLGQKAHSDNRDGGRLEGDLKEEGNKGLMGYGSGGHRKEGGGQSGRMAGKTPRFQQVPE